MNNRPSFDRRREEFPTLQAGIHLLSHSLGPAPRGAHDALLAYVRRWEQHVSEDAWSGGWWDLLRDVGDRIARLIGAAPGTVQIQPSATAAMAVVASCIDFLSPARPKVITTALDFPSMGYLWYAQRHLGAEVVVIPSDDDIVVPTERILEAIDSRTQLVALSHVSYRSSYRVDARAIIDRAHEVGSMVALDVYQSVGAIRVNATEWCADFLTGGTIKWLCGGPACGYLYVRPDLIEQLKPRLTGWIAHANPFEFAHGPIEYDDTVRRFAQGTPNIPGLYSCLPGIKLIDEIGIDAIERESQRRTQRIVSYALDRGWALHSPLELARRGGTVMIKAERPAELVSQLAERGVFVDSRPGVGIRISPHFFNTDEEVDQALDILSRTLA